VKLTRSYTNILSACQGFSIAKYLLGWPLQWSVCYNICSDQFKCRSVCLEVDY